MTVRRTVFSFVSLLGLSVVAQLPGVAGAATPDVAARDAAARAALAETARGLESPSFAAQAACEKLAAASAPAVPVLMNVAREANLEAAVRAVGILEAIYVSAEAKGDGSAVDRAEFALDELTRTGRASVADRADVVLESHYDIRERRAVAEIEKLHGVAHFGTNGEMSVAWNQRLNPAPPRADRGGDSSKEKAELTLLIIGPKWTGGDEGLKQIARLKRLHVLYRIQGCPVSDEGIAHLRAAIPGLEIQVRGAAKLGITHAGTPGMEKGCVVQEVQPGEAAANAGLKPQDRIIRFGDRNVDHFDALVDLLRNYKPGDVVDAEIVRDESKIVVPITLTGWD